MTKAIKAAFTHSWGAFVRSGANAFRRARKGNVAMIFAVAIIPIMVTGAAGIDLARTLAVRSKMYAAVDAAALAVASRYSATPLTDAQADDLADKFFRANYKLDNSFGSPTAANATVDSTARSVTVSSNTAVPTTLMNIAGIQHVNLTASSNVVWGQTKIWVGLALDNTGSMCQSDTNTSNNGPCVTPVAGQKIFALKSATKALLTMFQNAAANPGDVRVSLIPFNRDVNVGTSNVGATWLDWTEWDEDHGQCHLNGVLMTGSSYNSQSECLAATTGSCSNTSFNGSQSQCSNAGSCTISSNTTQSSCTSAGTCSVSGFNTQSACSNAGVCSISGNTTQNSCTNAYRNLCTIAGTVMNGNNYDTQSECQNAGVCSIAGHNSRSACEAAYSGYVCRINGQNYTAAPRNTETGCEANVNGICRAPGYTTESACTRRPTPRSTWDTGTWTGTGSRGVWTAGVWSAQYGVWTSTPGVWTAGVWTSSPGIWTSYTGVWTPDHTAWTGCVADRGDENAPSSPAYDTVNTAPGASAASKFPVENYSSCPVSMLPLDYNWTALNSKVDAMVAQGNTNQTIGLAWAWHSLSQGNPLNPPSLPSNTIRHIILLSDGENTQNRWYSDRATIDARMNTLCTNAKNDNVIIWAVFVNIAGTAGNASSMKNCASGGEFGGKYIEVTSAGGIGTAFDAIGQQITNLRVAH